MAAFLLRARRPGLAAPALVVAAVLALMLTACGGGDDDVPTPTATFPAALPTEPPLLEATPEPTEEVDGTTQAGGQEYTVQSGDTLGAIADQFGVTVDAIVAANDIANADLIQPGDVLTIPAPE
jgi:LysM repeat protein